MGINEVEILIFIFAFILYHLLKRKKEMNIKRCMKGLCKTCPDNLTCKGKKKMRNKTLNRK